ncbi:MAG: lamin tail domain-containing protein [Bacteroidota bacterium]
MALLPATSLIAQLLINELMADNASVIADPNGEYEDWIEIYNAGGSPVDLMGYYVSDDTTDVLKHQISASLVVPAGGYLLLWADDEPSQGPAHLGFKLTANGESVILTAPDASTQLDSISFPALNEDESYGRLNDGGSPWLPWIVSTPGNGNSSGQSATNPPLISLASGVYTGNQSIYLSAAAGVSIYYTLDGTTPSDTASLYTNPITISNSTSLRTIAIQSGSAQSQEAFASYILNPTTNLPIVHLTIDPFYLYDDSLGFYVVGTNGVSGPCHTDPRNWSQDWEYQAQIALIETDGSVSFNENCGLSISGGCSRNGSKKSFNVAFKKKYGVSRINYPLFPGKEETNWSGFKLRSGGNYRHNRRIVDAVSHQIIDGALDIDHQSSRHVALYLNGEYWGLYNIRDRMNKSYVEAHYPDINSDSLDLIKLPRADASFRHWIYEEVSEGDNQAYHAMEDFAVANSLNNPANYAYMKSVLDMDSYLDYYIANLYYNNFDWPGNNMKVWRPREEGGKWRWMMFDLDFNIIGNIGPTNQDLLNQILNNTGTGSQRNPIACQLFRQLMENDEFEAELIQRMNTYLVAVWDTTRIYPIFDQMRNSMRSEVDADYNRWGGWNLSTWNTQMDLNDDKYAIRPENVKQMFENTLGLAGRFQLNLNVNAATHGEVVLHNNHFRVANNHSGEYHVNVPIRLTAVPEPGYRFSHWQETGLTDVSIYESYAVNTTRTPVFVAAPDIVINEIHYHPTNGNAYEFIELYNPDSIARDISGYTFEKGITYTFPDGSIIQPGEYILLAADSTNYQGNGYRVLQWQSSRLDNGGESLLLVNQIGDSIDFVKYDDTSPWDELADGKGPSLELIGPELDNALAGNWLASAPMGGTPGAANSGACLASTQIRISEVMYNDSDIIGSLETGDWIELYNPTLADVSLTNWQIWDQDTFLTLPTTAMISAQSYLLLVEDSLAFSSVHPGIGPIVELSELGLSAGGERILIRDNSGCRSDLVVYDDQTPWPDSADGDGFSLMCTDVMSDGNDPANWTASSNFSGTPGVLNQNFCVGFSSQILINETNYHGDSTADPGDWIEWYNPDSGPMDVSGWELHDENGFYRLPQGIGMAGEDYLVLADSVNAFAAVFPAVNDVLGDWDFALNNGGEHIHILSKNRCLVDQVRYNDTPPWPTEADGDGPTLALMDPKANNDFPGSWAPSTWGNAPTGTPGGPNQIPPPCTGDEGRIVINEILYSSDDAQDSGNWLELTNYGDNSIDLSGWLLIDEDTVFTIPMGTQLAAGGYLVIAENVLFFQNVYPGVSNVLPGSSMLNFDNKGERLLLYNANRCLIDLVEYDDTMPWPEAEPIDPLIALLDAGLDNNLGSSWAAADPRVGTPGEPNQWPCQPGLGGETLSLWLSGDLNQADGSIVDLWSDQSPAGNHATQVLAEEEPWFFNDILNGHGAVRFDGADDWLKVNGITDVLTGDASIYTVFIPQTDTDDGYILSTHLEGSNRIKFGHRVNGELIYDDDAPSLDFGIYFDRPTMIGMDVFSDSIAHSWVNGSAANDWVGFASATADRASIGQEYDGGGADNETSNHWKGDLAELFVFKGAISPENRQAIETYLNIKYGINIPVGSHQFYDFGTHPFHLAGIGKNVQQCLSQLDSRSAENGQLLQLSLTDTASLQHGEYLVWGHDGGSVSFADASQNVPPGIKRRVSRSWRVSETGMIGQVMMEANISELMAQGWGSADPVSWVWLVDDDGDFSDAEVYSPEESIDLQDGVWLSLAERDFVRLSARAILSGAYEPIDGLMQDDLRAANLIPLTDPYGLNTTMVPAILSQTGSDAVVDWMLVELRSGLDSSLVQQQAVLVQRDGDLMNVSGDTVLIFSGAQPADYYVSVRHRNHLGMMSANVVSLSLALTDIDFSSQSGAGTHAQREILPGVFALWAGDADADGTIRLQGGINDAAIIFLKVLSAPLNASFARNFILSGYHTEDLNLDGQVIFQGQSNDASVSFFNILSFPLNSSFSRNYIISAQLP